MLAGEPGQEMKVAFPGLNEMRIGMTG